MIVGEFLRKQVDYYRRSAESYELMSKTEGLPENIAELYKSFAQHDSGKQSMCEDMLYIFPDGILNMDTRWCEKTMEFEDRRGKGFVRFANIANADIFEYERELYLKLPECRKYESEINAIQLTGEECGCFSHFDSGNKVVPIFGKFVIEEFGGDE